MLKLFAGLALLTVLGALPSMADPAVQATATPAIETAVAGTLTALVPAATPAPGTPEATPETTPIVVTLPALAGERIPPPLDVTLPEGWEIVGYDVLVLNDVGEIRGVPLAVWQGAVPGGMGTIVLLWGFQNIVDPFPDDGTPVSPDLLFGGGGTPPPPDLWSDGLRLLRLAIVEQGCNIGTDLRRSYRVGLLSAVGTTFSAVECPELPDTRGWFAGLQHQGLNFIFYVYVEGQDVMSNEQLDTFYAARDLLQSVLDTVRFHDIPVVTATPTLHVTTTPAP